MARTPKTPECMTAGEINKVLDRLDAARSKITTRFIDSGRGHERHSEIVTKTDPLAEEYKRNSDAQWKLRLEISRRYGPGAPSRLPTHGRGFGPINRDICKR